MLNFDLTSMIANVGFPIVITIYLLTKFEKAIRENTTATKALIIYLKNRK